MTEQTWIDAVAALRNEREPGVLVTLIGVRGHAPRRAGAKMVVAADRTWGSIGGGNLEAEAIARSRRLLGEQGDGPTTFTIALSDRAPYRHGVQCCGGEATILLDPLPVRPAVAVFGIGHVGIELARILARLDIDLHLVDSRPEQLTAERLDVLIDPMARVTAHPTPVLPESVLGELPAGTHVVIMTHDHAEDAALCDAALRTGTLGSIGLIGSSSKWARFRRVLTAEHGHPARLVDTIRVPIGIPGITAKDPAAIAISIAADLVQRWESGSGPSAPSGTSAGAPDISPAPNPVISGSAVAVPAVS